MAVLIQHESKVPEGLALQRLDIAAVTLFPQYSRARVQGWIKSGDLKVDGVTARSKDKVFGGERISVSSMEEALKDDAEKIALTIVYEDDSLIIINKPAGLVVHPGAGNRGGTLLNALLHHDGRLATVPRAGIVHRLDKNTTGLMVVARNLEAQNFLVQEIQNRRVSRRYDALVYGNVIPSKGTIDAAIGRHLKQRTKMAIRYDGKPSVTHYRVLTQFAGQAHVECQLETGRTHQIRVHLQSKGFPIIGDPTYGGHYRRPQNAQEALSQLLKNYPHQALHSKHLALRHPETLEEHRWRVPAPDEFVELLRVLKEDE